MLRYLPLLLLITSLQVFSQDKSSANNFVDIPKLKEKSKPASNRYKDCPRFKVLTKYSARGVDLEYFNYVSSILIRLVERKLNEKENIKLIDSKTIFRLIVSIGVDGSISSFKVPYIEPLQDKKTLEEQLNKIKYKFESENSEGSCIAYEIILTFHYEVK